MGSNATGQAAKLFYGRGAIFKSQIFGNDIIKKVRDGL